MLSRAISRSSWVSSTSTTRAVTLNARPRRSRSTAVWPARGRVRLAAAARLSMSALISGWRMASRSLRRSGSANMSSRSARRSSSPPAVRMLRAEALGHRRQTGASRRHDAPRRLVGIDHRNAQFEKLRATVVLPLAMPPVRPMRRRGAMVSAEARQAQVAAHQSAAVHHREPPCGRQIRSEGHGRGAIPAPQRSSHAQHRARRGRQQDDRAAASASRARRRAPRSSLKSP